MNSAGFIFRLGCLSNVQSLPLFDKLLFDGALLTMKLFPKIIGIGIVGLLVAAVISAISMYTGAKVGGIQDEEYRYRLFQGELTKARLAHLGWLRTISEAIVAEKEEFTVGTDGHQCDFGKWYYSKETEETLKTKPEELQKAFHGIAAEHLDIHHFGGELIEMWDKNNLEPAAKYYNEEIAPLADTLLKQLSDMEELCQIEINRIRGEGDWWLKNQNLPTIGMLLLGLVILAPYAWLTARGIVQPLQTGGNILQGIATRGDTRQEIPAALTRRRDEIGDITQNIELVLHDYRALDVITDKLAEGDWQITVKEKSPEDSLNRGLAKMLDQVNDTLRKINDSVSQVATGAGEVTNAAQNLSDGSQQAAASLEEITASMSEISSQTKQNAESAGQARDLAMQTDKVAADGQKAMQEMITAMSQITKNSGEIQRVIKVIDDIAFQTNLLALNAAVEAARAGTHGKGFAVVAEEVRNLASRSAKAARETSDLIANSGAEIDHGAEIANRTAEVLHTIVDQIKKTTDLMAGIAAASDEQAQGVGQVTVGLQQIDSVTQQNTAAAEESASAANEMSSMSSTLQNLVAQFKLR